MGELRTSDVFVAGGQPTVTYNPRSKLNLDYEVRKYLDTRYKVLSISGPTKNGKTVLVRRVIPKGQGIWVSGGQVDSIEAFWNIVRDQLGEPQEKTETKETSKQVQVTGTTIVGANIAIAKGEVGGAVSKASTSAATDSVTRVASPASIIQTLLASKKPLVVDDFHYIDRAVQDRIIRSLKEPVFDGLPVILVSVPHRAFDAVRVEREMTGRVAQLAVPYWSDDELREIAERGFAALNVQADRALTERLVKESFQSPHLIQDFCGEVCRGNGVTQTEPVKKNLAAPGNWDVFFRSKASETAKREFERLRMGPRERRERKVRIFRNGDECDIYTAVLMAIAVAGPPAEITTRQVRDVLQEILNEGVPESHEITRVLEQMSDVARDKIEGEPVVDWDRDFGKLHITDPFFAFYLRWGTKLP
jgi:hypothetical protein